MISGSNASKTTRFELRTNEKRPENSMCMITGLELDQVCTSEIGSRLVAGYVKRVIKIARPPSGIKDYHDFLSTRLLAT